MPPEDSEQPTMPTRKQMIAWIERTIYNLDCDLPPDPGRVTIRRLNRAEYNNTIRDLLGVTFQPADDFPSDDVGNGFDNIGDVLTLPPLLMEKYLAAAERIAEEAIVGDPSQFTKSQRADRQRLKGEGSADYDEERRRWTIASEDGVVSAEFDFPSRRRIQDPRLRQPASRRRRSGQDGTAACGQSSSRRSTSMHSATCGPTRSRRGSMPASRSCRPTSSTTFTIPTTPTSSRRDRNLRVYGVRGRWPARSAAGRLSRDAPQADDRAARRQASRSSRPRKPTCGRS